MERKFKIFEELKAKAETNRSMSRRNETEREESLNTSGIRQTVNTPAFSANNQRDKINMLKKAVFSKLKKSRRETNFIVQSKAQFEKEVGNDEKNKNALRKSLFLTRRIRKKRILL